MDIAAWGHPYSEYPAGKDTLEDFRAGLARLREAGIDLYLPFVMTHGEHYFECETLGPPERDLLGPLLEAAAEVGVEVHPITGLGAVAVATEGGEGLYDPGPDRESLPSWARDWPCAAWPEHREKTCRAAEEMLSAYRPDGLHLDYLRYPNSLVLNGHPCACSRCQAEREKWLGRPLPEPADLADPGFQYQEVRMRSRFVKSVARGLRDVADEAGVPLSLAARARYLKDAVVEGQDWVEWCREGLLDFVCPMSYNPCPERFRRFVDEHTNLLIGAGSPLYCGIGRSSSLGKIDAGQMAEQIRYANAQGAEGVCIFHVGALEEDDFRALRKLRQALG